MIGRLTWNPAREIGLEGSACRSGPADVGAAARKGPWGSPTWRRAPVHPRLMCVTVRDGVVYDLRGIRPGDVAARRLYADGRYAGTASTSSVRR